MTAATDETSLTGLLSNAVAAARRLAGSEAELAAAELALARRRAAQGLALAIGALILGLAAVALGLAALVLGLVALDLPPWLAAALPCAVLALGAALMVGAARRCLSFAGLLPGRLIDRLRSLSEVLDERSPRDA